MNWGSEMTKKKDVRARAEAKKLMWEYYRDNKASLPKWIVECREEILTDLIRGLKVELSFSTILKNVEQGTEEQRVA